MSLKQWEHDSWLRSHKTSAQEIANLLAIVDRDLAEANSALSCDWQFGIAYNAALKLCTVLPYASGYRPEKKLAHYRTLQALPLILGPQHREDADYLDACRTKRNVLEYEHVGGISEDDVSELLAFVTDLRAEVRTWLDNNHPALVSQ